MATGIPVKLLDKAARDLCRTLGIVPEGVSRAPEGKTNLEWARDLLEVQVATMIALCKIGWMP